MPRILPLAVALVAPSLALAQTPAPRPLGGSVDLGYVSASGNTSVQTVSLGQKLTWKPAARLLFGQGARYVYGEADSVVNANLLAIDASADYTLIDRLALTAGGAFERNRFAGIARRYEESVGLAYSFSTAAADSVRVTLAGVWTQQTNIADERNDFVSARGGVYYKRPLGPNAVFQQALEALPNLETSDDWRINSETILLAQLRRNLALKLAYLVRYDNLPEPTFKPADRILTTGLQATF
jgi:putative salt-induced outer membrane protein YdiY